MNQAAWREPDEPVHGPLGGGRSRWWSWRAPADGTLVYRWRRISGEVVPFEVGIYTGEFLTNLTRVGGAVFPGVITQAEALPVTGNTTYHLAVDSLEPITSPSNVLQLEFKAPPPNNEFQRRHLRTIPAIAAGCKT